MRSAGAAQGGRALSHAQQRPVGLQVAELCDVNGGNMAADFLLFAHRPGAAHVESTQWRCLTCATCGCN